MKRPAVPEEGMGEFKLEKGSFLQSSRNTTHHSPQEISAIYKPATEWEKVFATHIHDKDITAGPH